jgi:hypothetical protein
MNTKILIYAFVLSILCSMVAFYLGVAHLPYAFESKFISDFVAFFTLLIFWTEIQTVGNISSERKLTYFLISFILLKFTILYYLIEKRKVRKFRMAT